MANASDPEEMSPSVLGFALSYPVAVLLAVGAMFGLVVITAALETHTPPARRRATRLALPRQVVDRADVLPVFEPVSPHRRAAEPVDPPAIAPVALPAPSTGIERWNPATFSPDFIDRDLLLGTHTEVEPALQEAVRRFDVVQPARVDRTTPPVRAVPPATVFVASGERPDSPTVEIGEPGADRDLAGVLFAAYVAAGGPEAGRVTGWVRALDAPPGLPELDRTTRLRGRPRRVVQLLRCRAGGRNWVTLDPDTDIGRGLRRRPPVDEVLAGLVWWWVVSTDERARVPAEYVKVLRAGLAGVRDQIHGHPSAATVDALLALAGDAEDARVAVRLESVPAGSFPRRGLDRGDPVPEPPAATVRIGA